MKTWNKFMALALATLMTGSFAACGGGGAPATPGTSDTSSSAPAGDSSTGGGTTTKKYELNEDGTRPALAEKYSLNLAF